MQETLALIWTHLRMIWRFRWLSLVVALFICAIGWAAVIAMPDQYMVSTKVFLDTRSMLRPLLRGLALDTRLQESTALMMRRTLLVRPNLETVARKTDLDLTAKTPEAFEVLLEELRENISVAGTERDNIYVIGYEHSDPEVAHRVVEAILNLFVERSLGESRRDAGKTKQFIDKQIAEYEARLSAAEARLSDFKQQNAGMLPGENTDYYARLVNVQGQLSTARLALEEATRRRDEYRNQLEGVDPLFETEIRTATTVALSHPLDGRIQALEGNLDSLLLQYTERHPDVVATRSILADLRKKREAELKNMPAPAASQLPGAGSNPVEQQLAIAMGTSEAEVSALTARVEEFERRAADIEKLVDTMPRVEAELKRLNRDYSVTRRNYEELVKRRESLNLSEQASQTSDNVQFNILEPPRVPVVPEGPNRPLFSAIVLLFALGVGVGVAWLCGLIRPAVYSSDELENSFGIPALGSVSRVWTQGEILRRRVDVSTFVIGCCVLVGLFAGLVALEVTNSELLDKVRDIDFAARIAKLVGQVI